MNTQIIEEKRKSEKEIVTQMIKLYCRGNHGAMKGKLCEKCQALADYAAARIDYCPHMEAKTFCSNCKTHCYKPIMQEQIRTVMRWSGPRMLFYHPAIAIRHLIESRKEKRKLS